MSNEAALFIIMMVWLLGGGGLNLCLLIIGYYITFMLCDITELSGYFFAGDEVVMGTYAIQCSIDSIFLTIAVGLSTIYHKFIKIYLVYAAIIGTSLVLNGLMMYDQFTDLSMVYRLHVLRQEFSIPLDVLFAVLGSGLVNVNYSFNHNLRAVNRSVYNRLNRISNHIKGA